MKAQQNGLLVIPDPSDPQVQERYKAGFGENFRSYGRLPMWDEESLCKRIEELRAIGLKNVYFKMAGYDRLIWNGYCVLRPWHRWIWLHSTAQAVALVTALVK